MALSFKTMVPFTILPIVESLCTTKSTLFITDENAEEIQTFKLRAYGGLRSNIASYCGWIDIKETTIDNVITIEIIKNKRGAIAIAPNEQGYCWNFETEEPELDETLSYWKMILNNMTHKGVEKYIRELRNIKKITNPTLQFVVDEAMLICIKQNYCGK